jgi:SAM-dependent methyltransferase
MTNNAGIDTFLASYLYALIGSHEPVNTVMHNDDEMFIFTLGQSRDREQAIRHYMRTGKEFLDSVDQIVKWRFGGFDRIGSFLDFACGYGRFTRFLVNKLPAERVWVSDISPAAVSFQEDQFHVHGVVSALQPDNVEFDRRFDCVFVLSLFSHLPEATFTPWLRKLFGLMNETGVLIFTVHDESMRPDLSMPESGFWFAENSEIDTISKRDYGTTIVTEAFVRAAIREASDGRASYRRVPRGAARHQDMYIVINGPVSEFSGFEYAWCPVGNLDVCKISASNVLNLGGWAGDFTPGGKIDDIQVLIDGIMMQRCLPFASRPDVVAFFNNDLRFSSSGFACNCRIPEHTSDSSTLTVKVISGTGLSTVIYHERIGQAGCVE